MEDKTKIMLAKSTITLCAVGAIITFFVALSLATPHAEGKESAILISQVIFNLLLLTIFFVYLIYRKSLGKLFFIFFILYIVFIVFYLFALMLHYTISS